MNLADAIRQAAQFSGQGMPSPTPTTPEITVVENMNAFEQPHRAPQLEVQMPEQPSQAVLGGSVVRLELFLGPEQLTSLFKSIVATQHTVMTLREAAAFLRIPANSLEQMAQDREVPSFQVDGKWRFSRASLEEWLTIRAAQEDKEA